MGNGANLDSSRPWLHNGHEGTVTMVAEPLRLTEEKATMLATLYGRARDYHAPNSILRDEHAVAALEQLSVDAAASGVRPGDVIGIALRANTFDDYARQFLSRHPDSVVLNLGCGLDSRVYRLDPGPAVTWYDIDQPEVMSVRQRVFPTRPGNVLISTSVTSQDWLNRVVDDKPVLVIAEGLTMYLAPEDGAGVFAAIIDRFPSGALIFDAFSRWGIRRQKASGIVQQSRATLRWGIDDPQELIGQIPALSVDSVTSAFARPRGVTLARSTRLMLATIRAIPRVRKLARIYRYKF